MIRFKKIRNWIIGLFIGSAVLAGGYVSLPEHGMGGAKEDVSDIEQVELEKKYLNAIKIKEDYKMEKASFVKEAKDENAIQIEVGNKELVEFTPEMTIKKWEDETSLKVKYKHNVTKKDQKIELKDNKIKWKNKKTEVHFYEVKKGDETINGATSTIDAYEFEVILLEKPISNKIEFDIETKGLEFYHQPELTQKEKDDGAFRPDNVIGSYAVYHESKQGDYSKMGKKNYKAGKAFHIYRPLIVDSIGIEVWGKLNITDNLLTVEIPQGFLDNAVYPVIVDPTFGYNTEGSATAPICYTSSGGRRSYRMGTPSAGVAGTADSISFWWYSTHSSIPIDLSVFINEEDSVASGQHGEIATAEEIDVTPPTSWALKTVNLNSENLSTGVNYILNILGNGYKGSPSTSYRTLIKCDYFDPADDVYSDVVYDSDANSYASLRDESPWLKDVVSSQYYKFSIYATYTASGGADRRIIPVH